MKKTKKIIYASAAAACLGVGALTASTASVSAESAEADVICRITDPRLSEISGMAPSGLHSGVMWVHNDSGDQARLYALRLSDCDVVGELTLRDTNARDFEGLAASKDSQGRSVLWVGDIGDNRDSWQEVYLYRVREPKNLGIKSARAKQFAFTYQDRPHNAETLMAHPVTGQLWVVTKQLASGAIYELPQRLSSSKVNIAKEISRTTGLITDGAVSPDGTRFVLRDYFDAYFFTGLPPGSLEQKEQLPGQYQGESIAWLPQQPGEVPQLVIASENDDRLLRITAPQEQQVSVPDQSEGENPADPPGEVTAPALDYWPLVMGVIGAVALVTGLIIMMKKPASNTNGSIKKAE